MTSTAKQPLDVVGFIGDAVRGRADDHVVLPLRLNRRPTEFESKASLEKDALGHLSTDSIDLRYRIHPSTDIKTAVGMVRSALAAISAEAEKLECRADEIAQDRVDGSNAAADEIRAALRDAGLPSLDV